LNTRSLLTALSTTLFLGCAAFEAPKTDAPKPDTPTARQVPGGPTLPEPDPVLNFQQELEQQREANTVLGRKIQNIDELAWTIWIYRVAPTACGGSSDANVSPTPAQATPPKYLVNAERAISLMNLAVALNRKVNIEYAEEQTTCHNWYGSSFAPKP
jgi:hypothetical protein